MIHTLGTFVGILRARGLAVSPGEAIDAGRALAIVDVADRSAVLSVLIATLAKRADDREVVADTFDRVFRAPPRPGRRRRKRRRSEPGDGRAARPGDTPAEHGKRPSRETGSGTRPTPTPTPAETPSESERRGTRLLRPRVRPAPDAATEPRLSRKPFRARWSRDETIALGETLRRELTRLRLRASRRKRRGSTGPLWVQRTLRANVGHDGVPLRLIRRRRAKRYPKLLLLVDVSHSVARAAAAFLTLATQLERAFSTTRVLLFVDSIHDATRDTRAFASLSGDPARLDALLAHHPDLNPLARSDHGRVFHQVCTREVLRRDTVCVILGDARNNFIDPAAWTLEDMQRRLARILWLVPEPMREWGTGDSAVFAYAPHVDVLAETADVDGLRLALARAL